MSLSHVLMMKIMIITMLMIVMMLNKNPLTRRRVTRARPMSPSPYRVAATVQQTPLPLTFNTRQDCAEIHFNARFSFFLIWEQV